MKKFTSYNKCIDYLFSLERVGIKYDLKNINLILDKLGRPEKSFKAIHIAGTNGKGSVSAMTNSILIESGFKTGLYTSPHILDFRERILIDGKLISKKFIVDFTNKLIPLIQKIKPSFFEVTTALAFEYFRQKQVKFAVIETGLGGRLDSTNVLNPIIEIITSISIDHTNFLGSTIEKITKEKAGIIKKNSVCIIGNVSATSKKIIKQVCKKQNAKFIDSDKTKISNLTLPLIGAYQQNNLRTAVAALKEILKKEKLPHIKKNIKRGLKNIVSNSNFHGRFELINKNPKIIIDVSHNEQSLKNLSDNLKQVQYKNLYVIFGLMKDKQIAQCISQIKKLKAEKIILTKPEYKRAAEPEELAEFFNSTKNIITKPDLKESYNFIKTAFKKDDLLLITGSFFVVSDFLKTYKKQ
ncbi:MAG TPA: folylpolyglutamate synthase/dihydrofolate synthase family protein [Ignavibacteria bacterium]|nr:folylpolyglutamate synthase/dihydrofolate synthase family protein [Ignavibacteria bacterium]